MSFDLEDHANTLLVRGITAEQQETKMANLERLAKQGYRVIKMIDHDKYEVKGAEGYYNPYTSKWTNQ